MSAETHGITTGAVARRLGVSPTTVRSWDQRYGIGPAARVDGKHRRWSAADVAMLEEMCRLTASGVPPAEAAHAARSSRPGAVTGPAEPSAVAVPGAVTGPAEPLTVAVPGVVTGPAEPPAVSVPEPAESTGSVASDASTAGRAPSRARRAGPGGGLPLGDVRQECRGLARAAVRLDAPAMEALLREVLARYGLVTAWEEVMAPTLHAVGRKWESSDDRYVEVEHLLSWHVSTALRAAAVAGPVPTASGPPVVLACVPSEQHTLPLEALAAGLAERGLPTRMFGAAVPTHALDAAVRRSGPAAVALWSQSRFTADHALARRVAGTTFGVRGARLAPLVVLAGPGWSGRALAPGMVRPSGLRKGIDLICRLYGDPDHRTAP
ncbi:MerR family transcriptional regulator [Streptomyces sp. NPDC056049]|uniref:MerR family transcriptional regulator n=1 Tax=Streptomyces sp. NPDC056049 TaxID=3345693 RepID=UPI0035E32FC5